MKLFDNHKDLGDWKDSVKTAYLKTGLRFNGTPNKIAMTFS